LANGNGRDRIAWGVTDCERAILTRHGALSAVYSYLIGSTAPTALQTMAKTTLLTATLPNGETVTRRTARTYTHVVVRHRAAGIYTGWLTDDQGEVVAGKKFYPETWHVVGWAGRPDLAAKQAAAAGGIVVQVNS